MTLSHFDVLVAVRDTKVWSMPEFGRELMSADEQRRLATFSRRARQEEYIAAHTLARICLDEMFPGTLRQWVVSASGPVLVEGPQQGWVSLSHSDGWVAAVVSTKGRVGIDIECPKSNRDWQGVAARYFPRSEVDWLGKLDAVSGRRAFYQLWTTKEAYLKALSLNFYNGYRLLEQEGENVDPLDAETRKRLESWCIKRGWRRDELAFCIFAESAASVGFLEE